VCGDVGFGKTEVAVARRLRHWRWRASRWPSWCPDDAAVAPALRTFSERFAGCRSALLIVALHLAKDAKDTRRGSRAASRHRDRHACALGGRVSASATSAPDATKSSISGHAQGTAQEPQGGVHVLTLTRSPIPRTLNWRLSGVRGGSFVSPTAPIDRLAVAYLRNAVRSFDGARAAVARALRAPEFFMSCRASPIFQAHRNS